MTNAIANKRALAVAMHSLIKTNAPDLPHIEAVSNALAQVFSDMLGVDVTLVMRMDRAQLAQVIKEQA